MHKEAPPELDLVDLYFKEPRTPQLTIEEEVECSLYVQAGKYASQQMDKEHTASDYTELQKTIDKGMAARNLLVNANRGLAVKIANKFFPDIPFLDRIQEANVALIKAANYYEWQQGIKFSDYAGVVIQREISGMQTSERSIYLPHHVGKIMRDINDFRTSFEETHSRLPSVTEIAENFNMSREQAFDYTLGTVEPLRLEAPLTNTSDSLFGEFVEDSTQMPVPEEAEYNIFLAHIEKALDHIPQHEARILRLRNGLEDGICHSLEEVGEIMGMNRENVRQKQERALNRIRISKHGVVLRDFCEYEVSQPLP